MTGDLREQLFGSLPPDWDVTRFKHVCSVTADYGANVPADEYTDDGMRFIRTTDINEDGTLDESVDPVFVPSELVEDYVLKSGDLLVSRSGTVGLSYLVDTDLDGAAAYAGYLVRFRPARPRDPRFLYYFTKSRPFTQQIDALSTQTTISNFSGRKYADMLVPVAPSKIERDVANFLDEKITGINQVVEDRKTLIERLEEKRQALIRKAVARGFKESRPVRSARTPWLDVVPEAWDEVQIRFVARLESGHTPSRSKPEYWADEKLTVPWVTLADVWQMREAKKEYIEQTEEMISEEGIANSGARMLPAGTVMLSRTASVGFSGIMARPMATSQDFANWICGPKLVPEYLLYVFRSMKPEFERLMAGSTHQTIYMPEIRRLMTPLPPRKEQEEIVNGLRERLRPLDSAIRDTRVQIEILQEYRASLITAAVTGQIDVRASTSAVA